jgi:UDP-N-acetylmuramoylalanine--D-glutamate ligase
MQRYDEALVLGLGVSGLAAARLLLSEGVRVTVLDRRRDRTLSARAADLSAAGAAVRIGHARLPREWTSGGDGGGGRVCVISPGLDTRSAWAAAVREAGVPLISELELGADRCRCPLLAVTGSNGKSTMVKLCAETLAAAGRRVRIGGNYGPALCEVAGGSADLDWIVAEVSSFQLENVHRFRPRVGVLLNVQPDHLDRHGDMDVYWGLKARMFTRMEPSDSGVVLDTCLARLRGLAGEARPAWVSFGCGRDADFRYADGAVTFRDGGERCRVELSGWFANPVTGATAAAAMAALHCCGVDPRTVGSAAAAFEPLPHRLQLVAERDGVRYVDDSKATNLSAMMAALGMMSRPCRLIAGGLGKEEDLGAAKEMLATKVLKVYLLGKAAEAMESAWSADVVCELCTDLETAVRRAREDAREGETVLLSPGCASFDQFRNYEDRGEQFQKFVNRIQKGR